MNYNKTTTNKKCENCETIISVPFWLSKIRRFCSKKCYGNFKSNKSQKIIKCLSCNNEFKLNKSRNQKFCSHECYRKTIDWNKLSILSKRKLGWRKDINLVSKNEKKHLDTQYRQWMLAVKNRDNWKCKILNKDCNGRLEAHHILNWVDYPELRYVINNGITLCQAHHPRKRAEEKRLSPYFMELVSVSKE